MPSVRFTVGLMSNLRFHFSVTLRDRRVGYVDRQTREIELMFLEITRILMNFAEGMQRRRNVSKSGVVYGRVRLRSRRRRREQRSVSQTSAAARIEAPKAPRAVGRAQHISREKSKISRRFAANTGSKKSPSRHHRTTLSGHIFKTDACIDNRKKIVKHQYLLYMSL